MEMVHEPDFTIKSAEKACTFLQHWSYAFGGSSVAGRKDDQLLFAWKPKGIREPESAFFFTTDSELIKFADGLLSNLVSTLQQAIRDTSDDTSVQLPSELTALATRLRQDIQESGQEVKSSQSPRDVLSMIKRWTQI